MDEVPKSREARYLRDGIAWTASASTPALAVGSHPTLTGTQSPCPMFHSPGAARLHQKSALGCRLASGQVRSDDGYHAAMGTTVLEPAATQAHRP